MSGKGDGGGFAKRKSGYKRGSRDLRAHGKLPYDWELNWKRAKNKEVFVYSSQLESSTLLDDYLVISKLIIHYHALTLRFL